MSMYVVNIAAARDPRHIPNPKRHNSTIMVVAVIPAVSMTMAGRRVFTIIPITIIPTVTTIMLGSVIPAVSLAGRRVIVAIAALDER